MPAMITRCAPLLFLLLPFAHGCKQQQSYVKEADGATVPTWRIQALLNDKGELRVTQVLGSAAAAAAGATAPAGGGGQTAAQPPGTALPAAARRCRLPT